MGIVPEGQVGVVDVDSLNLRHDKLRNIGSKLYQQFQLQLGVQATYVCMFTNGKHVSYVRTYSSARELTSGSLICVACVRSMTISNDLSVQLFSNVIM